jgi:hypothetical protein
VDGADAYPIPGRYGEDVAHPMTDGIDTVGSNAVLVHQDSLHGIGTTLRELEVLFFRTLW